MNVQSPTEDAPVVIKKYANRRLYNTATSSYVTLDNLSQLLREGGNFVVYDAKTGDDITHAVLCQIIIEEEQKGGNLLPASFLRQLISFYGGNMRWMLPRYLEFAMKSFARNQEKLVENMPPTLSQLFSFAPIEEISKQNMAMFEQAMKLWTPFLENAASGGAEQPASAATSAPPPADSDTAASIRELGAKLNALQQQLDAISSKKV